MDLKNIIEINPFIWDNPLFGSRPFIGNDYE